MAKKKAATPKPTALTATAESGEVFTRKTKNTYTHAVYMEATMSDGRVVNYTPSWVGRPDLVEKAMKRVTALAGYRQGKELLEFDRENGGTIATGIFFESVRGVAVPVNA
ncbi:hypothetical protein SynSYN20_01603 [Synechococcus sp. SYN20]|uniref:hypothetical protein n=1 Tax=Synechococcus sp. SYN20 TaxID=1050714 RepID=UPI0016488C07|nr:hypothetical protein [Synechococcus sp. SYN20]QNJ25930.1 hypothetical protein SynSYN20_01603 [Synechococcus sp. SYN20]